MSPAISIVVSCESQKEINELWEKLSTGRSTEQCGWLRDKYGVSRQIVPAGLDEMLQGRDAGRSSRVMQTLLKMTKLDIAALKAAYGKK